MFNYLVAYSIQNPRTYAAISKEIERSCPRYVNIFETQVWFVYCPAPSSASLLQGFVPYLEKGDNIIVTRMTDEADWWGELVKQDCPNWFPESAQRPGHHNR